MTTPSMTVITESDKSPFLRSSQSLFILECPPRAFASSHSHSHSHPTSSAHNNSQDPVLSQQQAPRSSYKALLCRFPHRAACKVFSIQKQL
jgi:hypothetical protein